MNIETNILLSVIIPVYNACKHIEKCLLSVLNQNIDSLEIIIVDDGSTDGSYEECLKLSNTDSRIVLLKQGNLGQSSARNSGLNICKGKYITFVDSDDEVLPDTYPKNLEILQNSNEIDIVCFPYIFPYNQEKNATYMQETFVVRNEFEIMKALVSQKINHAPWNKIYRRKVFDKLRFLQGRIYEDTYLMAQLAENDYCVFCSSFGAYAYNVWQNSTMTSSVSQKKNIDKFIAYERLLRVLSKYEKLMRYRYYTLYYSWCLLSAIWVFRHTAEVEDKLFLSSLDEFEKLPLNLTSVLFCHGLPLREKLRLVLVKLFGVKKML